jgi:hypothetical protein
MTSFRRLIIGIAEGAALFSIFIFTLVGGIAGAASGAFRSSIYGLATNIDMHVQGIGNVGSIGAVLGFIIGAIGGFVVSAIMAGTLFIFIQIERNTRSLLEREQDRDQYEVPYRTAPRF